MKIQPSVSTLVIFLVVSGFLFLALPETGNAVNWGNSHLTSNVARFLHLYQCDIYFGTM